MKELSLHILDIAQNSVKANATLIQIMIEENTAADTLRITVTDNGCGMDKDLLQRVRDPFTTTRTTRKVGMGIPLLEAAAVGCDGSLEIQSQPGVGTTLCAVFGLSHIDRAPVGDMPGTMNVLVSGSPQLDFVYTHTVDGTSFTFDTREIRAELDGVPLNEPEVAAWIQAYIQEGLDSLKTN